MEHPQNGYCETEIKAHYPIPTINQLNYHQEELAAFIHFGMNTFTNKEWGDGTESPQLFNPSDLDTDQWIKVLKETGFKRVILVVKHHDGFVLYPSSYTQHSVTYSPWKNGKGDVLREISDSANRYDMNLGIYLSPWDAHHPDYHVDTQQAYNQYYLNQLKEILENPHYGHHGKFVEIWMDGARGEGAQKVTYDFEKWFEYIEKQLPDVNLFSSEATSVHWIGNERGTVSETKWHKLKKQTFSQLTNDQLNTGEADGDYYSVGEADVSIRSGWFFHENQSPKSLSELMTIYFHSVGRGTPLLLNIPPNQNGKFDSKDIQRLYEFHEAIQALYHCSYILDAKISVSSIRQHPMYSIHHLIDGQDETLFAFSNDSLQGTIEIDLSSPKTIDLIEIKEAIQLGQRISQFVVEVELNHQWIQYAKGTTVGYRRLILGSPITTQRIRIVFNNAQATPVLNGINIYKVPKYLEKNVNTVGAYQYYSPDSYSSKTNKWDLLNNQDNQTEMKITTQDYLASLTYQFQGTHFFFYHESKNLFDIYDILIDNQKILDSDWTICSLKQQGYLYSSPTLPMKDHHLTFTNKQHHCMTLQGMYVLNNQAKGVCTFVTDHHSVQRGESFKISLNRVGGTNGTLNVVLITEPGTGVHGKVYKDVTLPICFADGQTTIVVTLQTLYFTEVNEKTFYLKLISNENQDSIGAIHQMLVTVV